MGAVAFANHHDGNLAAILLMSFTVVSGLVAPRAEKPKLLREQHAVEDVVLSRKPWNGRVWSTCWPAERAR